MDSGAETKANSTYAEWFAALRAELATYGTGWERYAAGISIDEPAWREAYDRGDSAADTADEERDAAGR